MKRWVQLVAVATVASASALAGPQDNSLVVGTNSEPVVLAGDFLNVLSNSVIKGEIEGYLTAPLLVINAEAQPQPVLVTEVPSLNNGRLRSTEVGGGKRRLEMDFTLKSGLRWSDGDPLDTDDLAFFAEVAKAKGMPLPNADLWDRLNIRVRDKLNFTAVLEPAYYYDATASFADNFLAPSHKMRAEWDRTKALAAPLELPKDAERLSELYRSFFQRFSTPQAINSGQLAYSGAFRATRWVSGNSIDMARNPNFTAITPEGGADKYVQRVIYRIITNTNSLLVALLGGGIDATSNQGLTSDQARSRQLTSRAAGRFEIWSIPSTAFEKITLNKYTDFARVKELGLDDKRTRQAMLFAINREAWVRSFFAGSEPVASAWIPATHPLYNPDVTQYPYNPQRATELLAAMGWRRGADGILERTVGGKTVRFEIEFSTTAGNAVRERTQQFFNEQWRQVGISVRVTNAPASVLLAGNFYQRGEEGKWQMLMFGLFSSLQEDGSLFQYRNLNSNTVLVPSKENNFSGLNFGGWRNDEFDRVTSQAVTEFDPVKRKELFARAQQIWSDEVPSLPLRFRATPLVVRSGLNNYVASTFSGQVGVPGWNAWEIGWASRGAVKRYDQARIGGIPIR
ncbi:MAG: peptide ABC transporter substrate-binding protein [Meiothermus sp.]|nr:peptide ABC transporter substrate-binding protein [Meiothermus sp.]